jgi:hypothetical protein
LDRAERQDVLAVGVGSAITNPAINKKLDDATKGIVNSLSFGGGLGYDFKDKRLGLTL